MGTVDPWSRRRVHRPGKGLVFNPKAPGMSDLNGRSHGEYYEDGKVFKGELWGTEKKIIKFAAKRLDGWNLIKNAGKKLGKNSIGQDGDNGSRASEQHSPAEKQENNSGNGGKDAGKLEFAIASAVIRYLKNKIACPSGGGFSGDDLKELVFAVAVALAVVITELLLAYHKNKRAESGTGNSPDPAKISITVNQPVGSINKESPDCAPISITVYQQVGMKEQFFDFINGPITDNPQSGGVKKEEPSVLGKLSTTGDQHSVVMNKELPELNVPISSESENNEEDVSKVTMFQVGKSSLDEIERAGFSGGVPDDSPTSGNIEQAGTEEGGCSYRVTDACIFVASACFALYTIIRA